ncbi:MAG: hypothetical protein QNJ70_31665 [Xenococcaceae cyanobacterium MO_207.B15]|nr:hypothetical protein [Xenococcaceae cyanobacterium MO_207.B15]
MQINLATSLINLGGKSNNKTPDLLQQTITQAQQLNNPKLESSALGKLGHYYEQNQQWQQAQTATEKAILLANNSRADDIAVQWYWQQGRILKTTFKTNSI